MYILKMNELVGVRMLIVFIGIIAVEYLRDK